jgi:membrane-associated phospholipid phosphatase
MNDQDSAFRQLFLRSIVALVAGTALVALCYFFVDRPVSFFVHDQGFARYPVLKEMTYPPPIVQTWTPVVLVLLAVRRCWGPFRRWEWVLFAAGIALVLADQFRETLSLACGRYWPDTWIKNNPSLIKNDAYGFHPFDFSHNDDTRASFPSGHTARMAAAIAVIWIAWPRWGWLGILAALPVIIGLVAMNYHFVGDVMGGAFVGGIVGAYAAYFCGLTRKD